MYTSKTEIHMVKNMLETLTSMLEMLIPLKILMPTLWASLIAYATWYFTSARHHAPLTREEAKILWKIHKQENRCRARGWREIKRKEKIIGFKCECGYKYIQNRPVTANTPTEKEHIQSQASVFDELHTTYKSK